ncbi:MAG: CRISPR-associated endonuclease Cas2 [Leptospiraceae bacterium]|nr:CRISPR-associated endonuclease Cas2 [Leptospiraceae bacterium]
MYIEVILCFDISSNRTRRKFIKEIRDLGFISIQESVFWGKILQAELRSVGKLFKEYLNKETDKAFVVNAKFSEVIKENSFGYPDKDIFTDKGFTII